MKKKLPKIRGRKKKTPKQKTKLELSQPMMAGSQKIRNLLGISTHL